MRDINISTLLELLESKEVIWIVGLVAVIMIGAFWGLMVLRKRLIAGGGAKKSAAPFTLEELRQMQRDNRITEAEYKVLRDKIIQSNQ